MDQSPTFDDYVDKLRKVREALDGGEPGDALDKLLEIRESGVFSSDLDRQIEALRNQPGSATIKAVGRWVQNVIGQIQNRGGDIFSRLEEVSEVARVERKEIGRTYRYVAQELELKMEPVDPKQYVPRFASELELSEEVQSKANEIIDTTAEQGLLSGKSPTGYAAAAIYAASLLCNEKKTQREVADVAQVTEVTIRNRYQEQIEAMGIH